MLPGQDDAYFAPADGENDFWYVTDGVAEYHLQYTSSSTATVQTRLLVAVVSPATQETANENPITPPGIIYCTFKLSKVNGAWLINNIKDIENTLISASIHTS